MNAYIGDFVAVAMLILNLVSAIRSHKFSKKMFEKGLFNNRQLLASLLEDIVSLVGHNTASTETAPTTLNPAQFGQTTSVAQPMVTTYPGEKP